MTTHSAPELTPDQLDTLRHMLGINTPYDKSPKPYRNYYCANPGNKELHGLSALGTVELYSTRDGYEWWQCTDAGKAAALASHKQIRHTKGSRVYSHFLDVKDCYPDLTFKEFLTDQQFAKTRREA